MSKIKWSRLRSNENYKTAHAGDKLVGWIALIDGQWIARSETGGIRADFDTMQEAQDFLTTIFNAQGEDE
jgi:hypothetical protein